MEAVWFKSVHHLGALTGELPVIVCLSLGTRYVANGFKQAMVVKPRYPFERCELNCFLASPCQSGESGCCPAQVGARRSLAPAHRERSQFASNCLEPTIAAALWSAREPPENSEWLWTMAICGISFSIHLMHLYGAEAQSQTWFGRFGRDGPPVGERNLLTDRQA